MTTELTPNSHVKTPGMVRLLDNLEKDYYCELRPSKIHGVGVFAFRDIPEGTNPFQIANRKAISEIILLREEDVEEMSKEQRERVKHHFIKCEAYNQSYYPTHINGLNAINISFYMNHSEKPNMGVDKDSLVQVSHNLFNPFAAKRDIEAGEELCWDYRTDADAVYDQYDFLKKDSAVKKWWEKITKST